MSRIIDIIRRVVKQELARQRGSLLGVVTAVFPHAAENDQNNYEANVRLKHEDLELRQVPLAVGHIGLAAPPRVGDLVLVQFLDGDINQPVITGRFYHDQDRPPLHQENEILFEHRVPDQNRTLNHFRFTADGTIYLQRDVPPPEETRQPKTTLKIDGATGSFECKVGQHLVIALTTDGSNDKIAITATGKPIEVTCQTMKITGDLVVTNGSTKTTISGNEITGGMHNG